MGLNIEPAMRVIADSKDITDKVRERFRSLSLTDCAGTESDTVEITLSDHLPDKPIAVPPRGAELEVFIGYGEDVQRKGLFVVDEIELAGFPCEMVIRARAAPQEKSKGGKTDLQTQKTRSWAKGTTIGAMVKRIAGEHRMTPAVSSELSSIALPATDQSHESDMNLLSRIAKRYDAIAKPAGGALVFAKRGDAKSASGADLPRVTLTPKDGGAYRVTIASREGSGSVVAYYRDTRKAKRHQVTAGEGEPVVRLRMSYADAVSATNAAKAKHRSGARSLRKMTYTLPGRPELAAEAIVVMKGFRADVDGEWLIERVEHYIGPNGFTSRIECVQPNSAEGPAKAGGAKVEDTEQVATVVE